MKIKAHGKYTMKKSPVMTAYPKDNRVRYIHVTNLEEDMIEYIIDFFKEYGSYDYSVLSYRMIEEGILLIDTPIFDITVEVNEVVVIDQSGNVHFYDHSAFGIKFDSVGSRK